jgi:hypothetical protein
MKSEEHESGEEVRGYDKLQAELAGLHRQVTSVPPEVDRAIVSAAWAHLGGAARRPAQWRPLLPWLAAAACLAFLAWASQTLFHTGPAAPPSLAREDVNRDGHLNILDAFALARQIERGLAAGGDLNRDGVVDHRDVDALAARVVRLEIGS